MTTERIELLKIENHELSRQIELLTELDRLERSREYSKQKKRRAQQSYDREVFEYRVKEGRR